MSERSPTAKSGALPTLLVMTSTYPRWQGDPEPGFVHELAKRLTGRFNVVVLGPHAPGALAREVLDGVEVVRYRYAPECLETLVNDGGIVTNLRGKPWKLLLVPGFLLSMAWSSFHLLRQRRIDVVHAHWLIPQGFIAATLTLIGERKPPFVVTSHGADLFALKGTVLQAMKRWVLGHAAAVTVVSQAMWEKAQELTGGIKKLSVQPMGVDLQSRFVPTRQVLRDENEILFVGRLVEKKGLRYLIDAMPTVVASRPRVRLRIAGFGPEEEALRRQVGALGLSDHVEFLGAVPQSGLPPLYQRAALFVAPFIEAQSGDQEGLGLVLVEATGCGCPVLAGDVPAVRDVVGGESPSIVDPRMQEALSATLLEVLENPRVAQERAQLLREHLVHRFDWRQVADRYAAILSHCVHRGG